ncbi:MAG: S26 family signal peptidase [Euryarchaeota archaeon]|nr:S26 family signal peptidase [Euryarchaeota archaeon]MBU4491542.1 S26 family signal peptidase [Euryarchaeota archaeon]MCG2727628.1 S26 family signal peptidase [Candidatus Methanoperedenaceae archaeon]
MGLIEKIKEFNESESFWIGLLRDFLFVISVVAVFASVSHIALGLYSPMVAVESGSMIPHIQIGDIIFVEGIDRTQIITYEKGKEMGHSSFDDYGDVILYRPYGREGVTPIIHRARYCVDMGEPMWAGGPPAPHAGYITKGDNTKTNPAYDQQGSISYLQPVKKEWVIGVARFYRVPVLGYVSLIPRKILSI